MAGCCCAEVVAAAGVEVAAGCVWFWMLSLIGDVGESRWWEPPESLVRFFFRNPRDGIEAFRASYSPAGTRMQSEGEPWQI